MIKVGLVEFSVVLVSGFINFYFKHGALKDNS